MVEKTIKILVEECWNNNKCHISNRGNTPHCNLSLNYNNPDTPVEVPCPYLNNKIKTCLGHTSMGAGHNPLYYFACDYREE